MSLATRPLTLLAGVAALFSLRVEAPATRNVPAVSEQQQLISRLLSGYQKQDPPLPDGATTVWLGLTINSFYSISESTMDYMVSFDLAQKWNDRRLKYETKDPSLQRLKLGEGKWNDIWVPDTFFRNEKRANFHEVTVHNRRLRLTADGTVSYVTKISATFSCPMHLQTYPLDTQNCPITFESFGYTSDTMTFEWQDERPVVDLGEDRQLPQFTLVGYTRHICDQNYTAGTYPCKEVRFVLRRDIGYYLIQVYVPSILIVILSWVSFWINIESSPSRVSIGLLTVLTTTTMSAAARTSLPRVSYIKAIDVWMIICLIFVFASLIEYAVVNVISRKKTKKVTTPLPPPPQGGASPPQPSDGLNSLFAPQQDPRRSLCKCVNAPGGAGGAAGGGKPPAEMDNKRRARNIDKLSRQFFPIAFVLFNVVYWPAYVIPTQMIDDENIEV